jgi:hypothetical protein
VPVVAVLGAIGPDKGFAPPSSGWSASRDATEVRVRFVLIGYNDAENGPWQDSDATFTIHGRYEPSEVPSLFAHYRVKLVAFPSTGPESFSLTLSEAWSAGLPDHRATNRRPSRNAMRASDAGWGVDRSRVAQRRCDARSDRRARRSLEERRACGGPACARAPSPSTRYRRMTGRTLAQYDALRNSQARRARRFLGPSACATALGYVGWSLSGDAGFVARARFINPRGFVRVLRGAAHGLRRSFAGRAARAVDAGEDPQRVEAAASRDAGIAVPGSGSNVAAAISGAAAQSTPCSAIAAHSR